MGGFDEEILEVLRIPLASGQVRVLTETEATERDHELITRFPIVCGRIAWWEIEPKREVHVEGTSLEKEEIVKTFLLEAAATENLDPDSPVLYSGDNTDIIVEMKYATLVPDAAELFAVSQHSAVFPAGGSVVHLPHIRGRSVFRMGATA